MNTCTYCDANAIFRDRSDGAKLCLAHSRLEVTGPRGEAPRPPVTVRPAVPADSPRIAELAIHFWGEVEVETFGRRHHVDTLSAFVACDEDEIIGVAGYSYEENAVNLVILAVMPRWQGRGVAHLLVSALIEIARAEHVERIILTTTNDDLPALSFYQRLGFVITKVLVGKMIEHHGGVEPGFDSIPVRDEIQLELKL